MQPNRRLVEDIQRPGELRAERGLGVLGCVDRGPVRWMKKRYLRYQAEEVPSKNGVS